MVIFTKQVTETKYNILLIYTFYLIILKTNVKTNVKPSIFNILLNLYS
jgi:hypothetical protein